MKEKIEKLNVIVKNIMNNCNNQIMGPYVNQDIINIKNNIIEIAVDFKETDEYMYNKLMDIKDRLFCGMNSINLFQLGELKVLLEIISREENTQKCDETFWNIINSQISKVSKDKFDSGFYADAVESALKEINSKLKQVFKEKCPNNKIPDGADLMNKIFSIGNPILKIDDITNDSGRDIQIGYMQIFAGSMTGIRNPKAHENLIITKEDATHKIFLASLLMNKVEQALKNELKE